MLQTYAEVSPSGVGVKAFFLLSAGQARPFLDWLGVDPDKKGFGKRAVPGRSGAGHRPGVECYAGDRFFTVTGRLWSRDHPQIALLNSPQLERAGGAAATAPGEIVVVLGQ